MLNRFIEWMYRPSRIQDLEYRVAVNEQIIMEMREELLAIHYKEIYAYRTKDAKG